MPATRVAGGMFRCKPMEFNRRFNVIASAGCDLVRWEHVSVSLEHECPTWDVMCWVKRRFWDDEDCVVQFHPPSSVAVNVHPYCLHLWRPIGVEIPLPPRIAL